MKKVLITMAVLVSMIAGTMVLSSFTAPKQDVKENTSEIINDDGWDDYAIVMACPYNKHNGQWERDRTLVCSKDLLVQRKAMCGTPEYRIKIKGTWCPVSSSPVDDYRYCGYLNGVAYCFDM